VASKGSSGESDGSFFPVFDPYRMEKVGEAPDLGFGEIDASISALSRPMGPIPFQAIREALEDSARRIKKDASEYAFLISRESGLCLKDSRIELDRVFACLEECLRIISARAPETVHAFPKGSWRLLKEPFSLVFAITPFNHPLLQVCHKLLPALIVGAPILVKPCEKTPLSALKFIGQLWDSGIPRERLQIATTSRPAETAARIFDCEKLDAVAFTGSFATGRMIAKTIAQSKNPMVRQIHELGGSSPLVVCADGDIGKAVEIALSAFRNSGQRCTTIRKIFIENRIAGSFLSEFIPAVRKLRVDDPLLEATDIGTVIDSGAAENIEAAIVDATGKGAEVLTGGQRAGAQIWPTVLLSPPESARILTQEIFGPVLPVLLFEELDEVIRVVRRSNQYRLSGSIVTRSKDTALALAKALEVGQFNHNAAPGFRLEGAPFGGYKHSGNGSKEGILSASENFQRSTTFYSHE